MKNLKSKSDEDLMLAIRKRKSEEAFNELYARYSHRLLLFMYKMLNQDENKAQDFLHDIFLQLIKRPDQFNPEKKFKPWIFTVAANKCRNEYRLKKLNNLSGMENHLYINEKSTNNIDHALFANELKIALNELIPIYKEVFILRYDDGLSLKEIAAVLDCPLGTIKSRLHSATKLLSDKLIHFQNH